MRQGGTQRRNEKDTHCEIKRGTERNAGKKEIVCVCVRERERERERERKRGRQREIFPMCES